MAVIITYIIIVFHNNSLVGLAFLFVMHFICYTIKVYNYEFKFYFRKILAENSTEFRSMSLREKMQIYVKTFKQCNFLEPDHVRWLTDDHNLRHNTAFYPRPAAESDSSSASSNSSVREELPPYTDAEEINLIRPTAKNHPFLAVIV